MVVMMPKQCYGLENKVAVVTGGSRGIGLEVAKALLAENANVIICARKALGLEQALAALGGGPNLNAIQAHIAKEADVEAMFDEIMSLHGRVDLLINNVGMNLLTPGLVDTDLSLWQKIVDTNLNGTFLCSKRAARIMKNQDGGKIVSISSTAAHRAALGMGIYGVAKAGIEMMTRVLAAELAQHNIQVNAVAPSMVKTDFSKPFWSNDDIHDSIVKTIPLARLAEPEDVVQPVLFLLSAGANYITGQTLMVDGGSTAI
jgi:NAD(P)-dependent dehydrogenase (short-subunit alcohol dehydrogenase family)